MRHRVKKTIFNKDTKHRQAMLRNGVRNLVLHGQVKTTRAKAKEYQRWADKLIFKARQNTLASRRQLHQFFGKRDVVNTLVERVAPVFKSRKSGFTRMVDVGRRRGDNTPLVQLELVKKPENLGSLKRPTQTKKKEVVSNIKTAKSKKIESKSGQKTTGKKQLSPSQLRTLKPKRLAPKPVISKRQVNNAKNIHAKTS